MEGNNDESPKEPKPNCCARCRTNMRDFGRFIYNSETKEVLGRGGISWLKVLSFYLGFYCVLAGFWATCLVVFIKTLDPVAPTMQKMFSMMKDNPGMNYEPFLVNTSATLISFDPKNKTTYDIYLWRLNTVYSEYVNRLNAVGTRKRCAPGNGATVDESCHFDMAELGRNCTPETDFGYSIGKPCVLLRINKVFLWEPNNATFDSMDKCAESPQVKTKTECTRHYEFRNLSETVRSDVKPGYISVSCRGENDGDSDNIIGVSFYPPSGFPAYFYPYYNQPNYTTPLVMAQFDVVRGRVSMILCEFWTRDVIHDKNDLQGSIHFELLVGP